MTIEVRDLGYRHPGGRSGIHLRALSLAPDETLAIIGPSGSGKTTFLNLLSGLIPPDRGVIRVGDATVSEMSARQARDFRARSVGYIFQDFALLDYLSAEDNILHPFRITPGRRVTKEIRARARALAAELGIENRLRHRPAQLSHGERQRVAICRALATEPALILADEPTGNLDPETARHVMDQLLALRARQGAMLVMVTHDHTLLDRFDRVLDFHELWGPVA